MRALGRIDLGTHSADSAHVRNRLALWLILAAVLSVAGGLVLVAVAASGAPFALVMYPIPQPAPVGP